MASYRAAKTFSHEEQIAFAELSGDYNPLHVDPVRSRRYIFGEQVVHGMHLVLWALDCLFSNQKGLYSVEKLSCTFNAPCKLDKSVEVTVEQTHGDEFNFSIKQSQMLVSSMSAFIVPVSKKTNSGVCELEHLYDLTATDESRIQHAEGSIDISCKQKNTLLRFEHLTKAVSLQTVATLISMSTLIGMVCPGEDSIFSEFVITAENCPDAEGLHYKVRNLDQRFNRVQLSIITPQYSGLAITFVRPKPFKVQPVSELQPLVQRKYVGKKALVVGGSRGLGAVATKLLAASGVDVLFTYCKCKSEADFIVDECCDFGLSVQSVKLDVLEPELPAISFRPDVILYFATPNAFQGGVGTFSQELFELYKKYYVCSFKNVVHSYCKPQQMSIFYPSTIAIDEQVEDMKEYIQAKLQGEELCQTLKSENTGWTVLSPRLPKTKSDQTNSILEVNRQDPAKLMMQYIEPLLAPKVKN